MACNTFIIIQLKVFPGIHLSYSLIFWYFSVYILIWNIYIYFFDVDFQLNFIMT